MNRKPRTVWRFCGAILLNGVFGALIMAFMIAANHENLRAPLQHPLQVLAGALLIPAIMLLARITPRRYRDKPGGLEWKDTLAKPVQIQWDDVVAARGEKDGIRLLLKAPDEKKIRRQLLPWGHLSDPNIGGYVAFSLEPLFDLPALVACAKWRARVQRTLRLHWPFVIPYGIALLLFVAGGIVGLPDPRAYEAIPPEKPILPAGPLLVVLSLLIFVVTMVVVLARFGMLFRTGRYDALGFLLPKQK